MSEYLVSAPIRTYEHPNTGSVIDIVPTIHVGEPSYYARLGDYVRARQDKGFIVQYESIAESEEPEYPLSLAGRFKHKLLIATMDASYDASVIATDASRYVAQPNDRLFREEGSTNVDVDESYTAANMGVLAQLDDLYSTTRFRRKLSKASRTKDVEQLNEFIFSVIKKGVETSLGTRRRLHPPSHKFIIDKRNEVALTGVDNTLETDPSAKIVLIWGLGHLAGLAAGLKRRDYEHVDSKDITVTFSPTIGQRQITKEQKELDKMKSKLQASSAKLEQARARRYQ
ncbi:MAG: hypothetical protein ABI354_01400 [Candidatus Saccharimonadales bacterium]